jgi:hypothetical protein
VTRRGPAPTAGPNAIHQTATTTVGTEATTGLRLAEDTAELVVEAVQRIEAGQAVLANALTVGDFALDEAALHTLAMNDRAVRLLVMVTVAR